MALIIMAMRHASRMGVDPYNSHLTMAKSYEFLCRIPAYLRKV